MAISEQAGYLCKAVFPNCNVTQKYVCIKACALVQYIAGERKKERIDFLQGMPLPLAVGALIRSVYRSNC